MLWRSWVCYIRNPKVIVIKTVMTFVFTFFSLSIFWSLDNDYQGAYDKAGFLFFFSLNNLLSILFNSILVFPKERVVFLRDYSNQLYRVSSYYLTKNIVETPLVLINAFLFGLFIYHATGLRTDGVEYFFQFLLIALILGYMSHSLGYCMSTSFSNLESATIVTQFTLVPFLLFSGFLKNVHNMANWIGWFHYLSPLRYLIEAMMKNELIGNKKVFLNADE